jgi:hypothetical protein
MQNLKVSTDDFNWSFSRAQPNGPPAAPTSQAAKTTDRQAMPVSCEPATRRFANIRRNRSSSEDSPEDDSLEDYLRGLPLEHEGPVEDLFGDHDSDDEYYSDEYYTDDDY